MGTGNVGATFAYALLFSGLAAEIVLINRDRETADGEAMDLSHSIPFAAPARIWAGTYEECAGAALTVLAAGAAQGEAPDRLSLAKQNGSIFGEIVPQVVRHNPGGILLVATNPVDVLTYATWKMSGLPRGRVIGSGTILDSARLCSLLGERLEVDPRDVSAVVVGEHGDSQVPLWSAAHVGGVPIRDVELGGGPLTRDDLVDIERRTREAGQAIAERKGATYYAVAAGLVRIARAVLRNERSVLSVSTVMANYPGLEGRNVALSLPSIVGRDGVESVLRLTFEPSEREALQHSASVIERAISKIDIG